jgi:hypothetical protein
MDQLLAWITTFVNIVGLAVSLCLGFYVVTRTPGRRRSWLTALTLWSLTALFTYNALALNIPEGRTVRWLRPVALLVLPLWFNLALLRPASWVQPRFHFYLPRMYLPGAVRQRLGRLLPIVSRLWVPLAYALALALLIGGVFPLGQLPEADLVPDVLLSDRVVDPLFSLSIVFLVFLGSLALWHLWHELKAAHNRAKKRLLTFLFIATVVAGAGGLYLGLGALLHLPLPAFVGDALVAVAAAILGFTVAEHNALAEGRAIRQELLYISLAIGLLTAFCILLAVLLHLGGHVFSLLTLIVIIIVGISSLMLYDGLRTTLDRLFYREQFRQLRANLRALAREAGTGQSLRGRLQAILHTLCRTLTIHKGFIALQEGDAFVCEVSEKADPVGTTFPTPILAATEIADLPRPGTDSPQDMILLVPIHAGDDQIGALVLGPKETGGPYGEEDLMLLDDLADQLATVIQASQRQEENAWAISEMVADFREREHALQRQVQQMLAEREEESRPVLEGVGEKEFISLVEGALRRLHDYPYLGEHSLARLQIVICCAEGRDEEFLTHIDRGKALSEVLVQAINKLRPEGPEPERHALPSRAWHQFITLHDAYVLDELNRDIMSRLYVGEGTFNRTRRRAIRGVAKALQEMEQEALQREKS